MKKVILISIPILILIFIVIGILQSSSEKTKECKMECRYNEVKKVWEYGSGGRLYGRTFPEQEQCIDYCITLKE